MVEGTFDIKHPRKKKKIAELAVKVWLIEEENLKNGTKS